MGTLTTYVAAIGQFVQGTIPLATADKNLAVAQAIKTHSRYKPRVIVEDMDGDGGFDYDLSDLEAWSDGFSVVRQVEYPVDDTEEDAAILDEDDWEIYTKPSGDVLRFVDDTPEADEDIRITYTGLHLCTSALCTVTTYDEEAVQALAAGFFCDMLATYFAQDTDSTIAADSVDHASKSRNYAARAKVLKKMYFDHMGVDPNGPVAGGFTIAKAPETARVRLVH